MVYLQINLNVAAKDRLAAAAIFNQYKAPFLTQVGGARSKELLIREEDVQVMHGFDSAEQAKSYLASKLFNDDVVTELSPLLTAGPEVRIYAAQ
ncbi:MAG: hypothetical protein ABI583_05415 [Betaproteobacteria bacterium]